MFILEFELCGGVGEGMIAAHGTFIAMMMVF
jgi:hypothetical protein